MADLTYSLPTLPYDPDEVKDVLSKQVVEWHHDKHHAGYVKKANEIEDALPDADTEASNANYSQYGELKRRQSFNLSGIILHNIYWANMGGDGKADMTLPVVNKITEDFGSMKNWVQDFKATAMASLGWAILAGNPITGRLENYLCDLHHDGAVWGAVPLIALDVFEHAYYKDYGPDRGSYVDAYIGNLNWKEVNKLYGKNAF
ncbi:MAG: superoxide dismutase [Candidatus Dojkabacteria bacterium]